MVHKSSNLTHIHNDMIEKFKHKLIKIDGRKLRWFYDVKIKPVSTLTYAGFAGQLNGYSPVSTAVMEQITAYMSGE